ncbi:3-hydroxymethyl-3-methylglutaryl-CoA lyase, cytoplasmic-like isoform X2 [Solanum pennellii]|uniref:hydroxymethylglutaryl-CoA lyase n=1 Tax=Solanum pennellii TaxID=28526 RepID=A0ABM1H275_SOLPN|nr:3-hydroxymethyl-3-methylglutaryl-CoA lyase, cytoplasmic-like isoform X2 [Solanum pennellii]
MRERTEEAIIDVIKSQQISSRSIGKVIVHSLVLLSIVDHYNRVAKDRRMLLRFCLELHLKVFEAAIAARAKEVAVFASTSESFTKSKINCTIKESLVRYQVVTSAAKKLEIPIRNRYVSCAIGCPVEGVISPSKVAYVAKELHDMNQRLLLLMIYAFSFRASVGFLTKYLFEIYQKGT